MATVPQFTAWAGRTKYQADGFLFDGVYEGALLMDTTESSQSHFLGMFPSLLFCTMYLLGRLQLKYNSTPIYYDVYIQSGPKKYIHSSLINIFGMFLMKFLFQCESVI